LKKLRERGFLTYQWIPEGVERILDLGCAAGHDTYHFSQKARYAYGFDYSAEAIASAKKKYPQIEFLQGDSSQLPFPCDFFDVVTFIEVLEHLPPKEEFPTIKEIYRVLKPGGIMILSTPHRGLFYFLDPLDAKFKIYRLIKWLMRTEKFIQVKRGFYGGLKGHKHYKLEEVINLIQWGFDVKKISRNSLIFHPLSTWIYLLISKLKLECKPLTKLLEKISDFDFKYEFGPLAYNMHLLATKKVPESGYEYPDDGD